VLWRSGDREDYTLANGLCASLEGYDLALRGNLESLTSRVWHAHKPADEQLAPLIRAIDDSVLEIRS
jgi:hypothetical protein